VVLAGGDQAALDAARAIRPALTAAASDLPGRVFDPGYFRRLAQEAGQVGRLVLLTARPLARAELSAGYAVGVEAYLEDSLPPETVGRRILRRLEPPLPYFQLAAGARRAIGARGHAAGFAPKVLVVDDDPEMLDAVAAGFEREGFVPYAARSGGEALGAARRLAPEAVVLDERLPDVRGMALVRWLRRRHPGMPAVLFSAFADWEMFFRASGCGARDVVAKDLSAREILRVVEHCVRAKC